MSVSLNILYHPPLTPISELKNIKKKPILSQEDFGRLPIKSKYGSSALKKEAIEAIQSKLSAVIMEQKPFLIKELNINKLADALEISSHQLSQFINSTYNKTFYDFINFYRVEEAKRLLAASSMNHYKIEAIGGVSGFNSRATFFTIFKKFTGTTPLAYKQSLLGAPA